MMEPISYLYRYLKWDWLGNWLRKFGISEVSPPVACRLRTMGRQQHGSGGLWFPVQEFIGVILNRGPEIWVLRKKAISLFFSFDFCIWKMERHRKSVLLLVLSLNACHSSDEDWNHEWKPPNHSIHKLLLREYINRKLEPRAGLNLMYLTLKFMYFTMFQLVS